nr:hypothetical protein MSRaV_19R [Micropterus salmoides ranavirus]WHA35612.1 hypothetical protein SCRaV_19R [Siniperca chuatsi ranavirus]
MSRLLSDTTAAVIASMAKRCDCGGKHSKLGPEGGNGPFRFNYGSSCLSDLLNRGLLVSVPRIVAIGSGDGYVDAALAEKVLGARSVVLTDINPGSENVVEMSCSRVVETCGDAALLFCFPFFAAGGYTDCLKDYQGDTVVYVGEMCESGHTNPGNLLEQLRESFVPGVCVELKKYPRKYPSTCVEHLVVFTR